MKKKGDNKAGHGIGRLNPVSNQRAGVLGGIGGSIITSSGMNQNFKDFAQGQDGINKVGAHSSSTGMFSKPNFSPGHSPTA